jgi:hypothetical protein
MLLRVRTGGRVCTLAQVIRVVGAYLGVNLGGCTHPPKYLQVLSEARGYSPNNIWGLQFVINSHRVGQAVYDTVLNKLRMQINP